MKKADNVHRAIAKAVDLVLVGVLTRMFVPFGILAGGLYILLSDGLFEGRSLGKKLVGLRVMLTEPKEGRAFCAFRESIVRNLPYAAVVVLGSIPIVGWFIFLPLGVVFLALETYFVYADDYGVRIGDMYAGTQVIDDNPARS